MENLKRLINKVSGAGWFGGELNLSINIYNSFEGYYGRASETWETSIVIESNEVKNFDKVVFPAIKVVGKRHETIDNIARRFLEELENEYKRINIITT